jgi:hypothetical protein
MKSAFRTADGEISAQSEAGISFQDRIRLLVFAAPVNDPRGNSAAHGKA